MEDFVHEYYSVEKFKKAYARRVELIGDKSLWPKVDIAHEVGSPIARRGVGRQKKNQIKSCLEGGSGKKKAQGNETEKTKKLIHGKFKCSNCGELGHRKNSYKCPLNGTKKRQVVTCFHHMKYVCFTKFFFIHHCRKRKPRKNTTKGWFPKQPAMGEGPSSEPQQPLSGDGMEMAVVPASGDGLDMVLSPTSEVLEMLFAPTSEVQDMGPGSMALTPTKKATTSRKRARKLTPKKKKIP
jgi:hypothetical protein